MDEVQAEQFPGLWTLCRHILSRLDGNACTVQGLPLDSSWMGFGCKAICERDTHPGAPDLFRALKQPGVETPKPQRSSNSLEVDSNHSFQPSLFSITDRCFPWGSDGFLERFGSLVKEWTCKCPLEIVVQWLPFSLFLLVAAPTKVVFPKKGPRFFQGH